MKEPQCVARVDGGTEGPPSGGLVDFYEVQLYIFLRFKGDVAKIGKIPMQRKGTVRTLSLTPILAPGKTTPPGKFQLVTFPPPTTAVVSHHPKSKNLPHGIDGPVMCERRFAVWGEKWSDLSSAAWEYSVEYIAGGRFFLEINF